MFKKKHHTVALFGAGKIGEAIVMLLTSSERYKVRVFDANEENIKRIALDYPSVSVYTTDLSRTYDIEREVAGCDAIISALPYFCNQQVAKIAGNTNIHYFDLTEDVSTTEAIKKIAREAQSIYLSQCGLAPGFVSIVAGSLMKKFDTVSSAKLRVGALPLYPSNILKYNPTWSVDGLINEYINPCKEIFQGELQFTKALEGYETISIDGIEYEAFNTSGGLGSLCETYLQSVATLNYKTIRYPGHRDLIHFLLQDLGFKDNRTLLKDLFIQNLPATKQDKCIVFVEIQGIKNGEFTQETFTKTVQGKEIKGRHLSAIQITTASGICTPLDMILTGKIKASLGFNSIEQIQLDDFLNNEFGRYYL
jgi:saccharopine dehydrogenase-like NADP-dependent oxidoreductase